MPSGRPKDEDRLLKEIPKDGSTVGNVTLRERLGWSADKYWKVRDLLIDNKELALGRGKGGSVRRTKAIEFKATAEDQTTDARTGTASQVDEQQLYPRIARVLREEWSNDLRLEQFFVEQTAKQGSKSTGGKWTRPDLVLVSVTTFQNLWGRFVDVTSFEVKTHNNFDVTAIYEALAHRRAATRAYVLISVPPENADGLSERLDDMLEEATRHGIGLIVAADVSSYSTWDVRADPQVSQPDPETLDEFLETQIAEENKRQLRKWVK